MVFAYLCSAGSTAVKHNFRHPSSGHYLMWFEKLNGQVRNLLNLFDAMAIHFEHIQIGSIDFIVLRLMMEQLQGQIVKIGCAPDGKYSFYKFVIIQGQEILSEGV